MAEENNVVQAAEAVAESAKPFTKGFGKGVREGFGQHGGWLGKAGTSVGNGLNRIRYGVGYTMGSAGINKPWKAVTLLAALGATGAYVVRRMRRDGAEDAQRDIHNSELDMSAARPDMMAMQPNTLMGMEPIAGAHAQRVAMQRAGGTQLGATAAVNPGMSVVPEESVQNLGQTR